MLDCFVVSSSFHKDLGVGFGDQNEELLHPNLDLMSWKKLINIMIKSLKNDIQPDVTFFNIQARRNFERVRIFCRSWKYHFEASKIFQTNRLHSTFQFIFEQNRKKNYLNVFIYKATFANKDFENKKLTLLGVVWW